MNTNNILFRRATLKDYEPICNLSNELGYSSNSTFIYKRLKEILSHAEHCVYLAEINENVIGWIHGFYTLRIESDPFVEIGGLIVSTNHRRKGIGKKLISKVESWAKDQDVYSLRVRCNIIRKESHSFYKSIRFEESKKQKIFDKKLK